MKDYVVIVEKRIVTKATGPEQAIKQFEKEYLKAGYSLRAVERRIDVND